MCGRHQSTVARDEIAGDSLVLDDRALLADFRGRLATELTSCWGVYRFFPSLITVCANRTDAETHTAIVGAAGRTAVSRFA